MDRRSISVVRKSGAGVKPGSVIKEVQGSEGEEEGSWCSTNLRMKLEWEVRSEKKRRKREGKSRFHPPKEGKK